MPVLSRRWFLGSAATVGLVLATGSLFAGCVHPMLAGAELPGRVAHLGVLALTSAEDNAPYIAAFTAGMRDLGYTVGSNLVIDERFAGGREELLPDLANDLVERRVDVLVTGSTQATLAALQATHRIPIVFTNSGDPLGAGLVASLARPGGNATGLTSLNRALAGKRIELLRSASPNIKRVAVLWSDTAEGDVNETRAAAFWLGLQVDTIRVGHPDALQPSLQQALDSRPDAVVAISTPLINSFADQIARFALQHRLPTISEQREFAAAGGLMAYGANVVELSRRAATYVDKILSGAQPADLPVERAERFEMTINLRTLQALNLVLPQPLLLQAAEVVS
jgi:putative ABC transport system substrate-binding protein